MSPTLQTKTSVGMETPQQTLGRASAMLATSQTPTQMAAPAFSLNLPDEIPSTSLRNSTTYEDVLAKRNRAEQDQFATQQLSGDYQNLFGRIGDTQNSPLSNPDQVINRLLLNRPTDTQSALDTAGQNQAQNTREFAGDYAQAGTDAREQFALPELQGNLAETRNRIAERTTQLRQTLRDFETNAERRGVDRQFVDAEKQAVQGKAAAELADLSIIENAQLGNLEQAQAEVDRVLVEKRQGFEMENMAIEQEIARLGKMDTREADIRKEQLQIALGERSRNIETALASEKESRGYLIEAANNGADNGTLDAIRNAKTPGEAAMLAGPWVGRIQRMQAQANIAQSYASAASSNTNRLLALAEAGDPDAIKQLKFDPRQVASEVDLDPTTVRQVTDQLTAGEQLLTLASRYKKLIDEKGFESTVYGSQETVGDYRALRSQITAAYKDAKKLGTLDAGLLTLMEGIIGEEPTSGAFTPATNFFGGRSNRISNQLDELIQATTNENAKSMLRLGINPTVLQADDTSEIEAAFSTDTSTPASTFDPSNFYNN